MYSKDFESFEPVHFLELSKELYKKKDGFDTEPSALKRTIVSRIYYAAFLHVRLWFINNKNYKSKGGVDHYEIPNFILDNTPMMRIFEKELKDKLIILGKNRKVCDYEFEIPPTKGKYAKFYAYSLEDLIKYSNDIINKFNNFS